MKSKPRRKSLGKNDRSPSLVSFLFVDPTQQNLSTTPCFCSDTETMRQKDHVLHEERPLLAEFSSFPQMIRKKRPKNSIDSGRVSIQSGIIWLQAVESLTESPDSSSISPNKSLSQAYFTTETADSLP
ncbi:MAG: hypothetical protein P4M13_11600 [Alphaproteobacteria bacterium]|nr:hypothetical protein [Alphaproteobacteria bacterium]